MGDLFATRNAEDLRAAELECRGISCRFSGCRGCVDKRSMRRGFGAAHLRGGRDPQAARLQSLKGSLMTTMFCFRAVGAASAVDPMALAGRQ